MKKKKQQQHLILFTHEQHNISYTIVSNKVSLMPHKVKLLFDSCCIRHSAPTTLATASSFIKYSYICMFLIIIVSTGSIHPKKKNKKKEEGDRREERSFNRK